MYLRNLPILISFWILTFFIFVPSVFAASITMQNAPSQIGINDEYTVDVTLSISVADNTIYYLRGAFYKNGTSNYCGYTWTGTGWFNGPYSTDWKSLPQAKIINHIWTGQVKAKVDADDTGCNSSGTYQFRIERFNDTSSDGAGTFNDTQNEQSVTIVIPTPTPTLTPIPTPTHTPVPPTSTPTPKIPTPTSKPLPTPTSVVRPSLTSAVATFGAVLGSSSAFQTTPTEIPTKVLAVSASKPSILVPILFIIAGFCLLGSCGILVFFQYKKEGKLW